MFERGGKRPRKRKGEARTVAPYDPIFMSSSRRIHDKACNPNSCGEDVASKGGTKSKTARECKEVDCGCEQAGRPLSDLVHHAHHAFAPPLFRCINSRCFLLSTCCNIAPSQPIPISQHITTCIFTPHILKRHVECTTSASEQGDCRYVCCVLSQWHCLIDGMYAIFRL